jgi:hypothetical protein
MWTRNAALESDGENTEQSPDDKSASQSLIHDPDISTCGPNATESSLKLQYGEFGACHGDDSEDARGIRELQEGQNADTASPTVVGERPCGTLRSSHRSKCRSVDQDRC